MEEDTITEEQIHFLVDFQAVESGWKELDKIRKSNLVQKDESNDDTPANEDDYQAQRWERVVKSDISSKHFIF